MTPDELFGLVRMLGALVFVLVLMGGLAFILKRLGLPGVTPRLQCKRRLQIVELLPLDARRRLALLQCDDEQHLVILGPSGETVIKTGIKPVTELPAPPCSLVDASAQPDR